MASNQSVGQRNSGSDVLRILLALTIVFAHFIVFINMNVATVTSFSVPFFFVTTGFLITKSFYGMVATGKKNLFLVFYIRRFFRILPVYFFVMFLVREFFPITFFYEKIFFISNFKFFFEINSYQEFINTFRHFNIHGDHVWYISALEQFYFLSPIILVGIFRIKVLGFIFLIVSSIIIRCYVLDNFDYKLFGLILPINIEYFLWGGLGYVITENNKKLVKFLKRFLPVVLFLFAIVLYFQVKVYGFTAYHVEVNHLQTVLAILSTLIFCGMNFYISNDFYRKILEFFSSLTLSICLIHPFIQSIFMFRFSMISIEGFIYSTIVTILASIVLLYLIEKPGNSIGYYVCNKLS